VTGLKELLAQPPATRQRPSKIQAILESLESEERALLEDALANGHHSSEALAAILTETGHPISATTIRAYRRSLQKDVR